MEKIPTDQIFYLDECGLDQYLYREYGYAPRGQKVQSRISGRKYKRCGIVAAMTQHRIIAPMQFNGTMDSSLFEYWFERQLLSELPAGAVIIMDNASFHRKRKLIPLAEKFHCSVLFLPPYSPDLNPIEHFWAWLKAKLRSLLSSAPSFDDALFEAFQLC